MNGASPAPAATGSEARKTSDSTCATRSFSPDHTDDQESPLVDARLAFLLSAAIRYDLVERDELDLDEAFGDLVGPVLEIIYPRPQTWGEALWANPGWREAAIDYHKQHGANVLIVQPGCLPEGW